MNGLCVRICNFYTCFQLVGYMYERFICPNIQLFYVFLFRVPRTVYVSKYTTFTLYFYQVCYKCLSCPNILLLHAFLFNWPWTVYVSKYVTFTVFYFVGYERFMCPNVQLLQMFCLVGHGRFMCPYICSAQSKNRDNSGIVLRKVRIFLLPDEVRILTLSKTILELLLRKVGIGTKWEYLSLCIYLLIVWKYVGLLNTTVFTLSIRTP